MVHPAYEDLGIGDCAGSGYGSVADTDQRLFTGISASYDCSRMFDGDGFFDAGILREFLPWCGRQFLAVGVYGSSAQRLRRGTYPLECQTGSIKY